MTHAYPEMRPMPQSTQAPIDRYPSAFFGMSNRLANLTSLRPNEEFYVLGRS